jgi:hypothetical protein
MLRRVLRKARALARKEGFAKRVRLDLKKPKYGRRLAGWLPIWRDNATHVLLDAATRRPPTPMRYWWVNQTRPSATSWPANTSDPPSAPTYLVNNESKS